jgi:hypothetical protein
VVGAALKSDGVPKRAILRARATDVIALSRAVYEEVDAVLRRPKFRRYLSDSDRHRILRLLSEAAVWVEPTETITDCRDHKDNKYLELAGASGADLLLSSDADLLVMDPWRGVRIIRPFDYLNRA